MNEDDWHTKSKCPKLGLHLVIHHLGNKDGKQAYRNGFTIVKDPRFLNGGQDHWPLRIELEPAYDKKRDTKTYFVVRNEFGRREYYSKFYQRMVDGNFALDSYQQVLDANKDGLWKKHPMRLQRNEEGIV